MNNKFRLNQLIYKLSYSDIKGCDDFYIVLNGIMTEMKLSDLFTGKYSCRNNTIKGFSILQFGEFDGSFIKINGNTLLSLYHKDSDTNIQFIAINKPFVQLSDKNITKSEFDSYINLLKINDTQVKEFISKENTEQIETKEIDVTDKLVEDTSSISDENKEILEKNIITDISDNNGDITKEIKKQTEISKEDTKEDTKEDIKEDTKEDTKEDNKNKYVISKKQFGLKYNSFLCTTKDGKLIFKTIFDDDSILLEFNSIKDAEDFLNKSNIKNEHSPINLSDKNIEIIINK